jgi:hypothetical protein
MKAKNRFFSAATWARRASTSVMFSAHYVDGHTVYFVLPNNERLSGNDPMQAALELQKAGELPTGCIAAVKRAR